MGSSHSSNVTSRSVESEQKWAHSYPRSPMRTYKHKVLPERDLHQKLRPTNNGEILNSGGTISGRHHRLSLESKDKKTVVHRSNSVSSNRPNEYQKNSPVNSHTRSYLADQRDPLHKVGHKFGYLEERNPKAASYKREYISKFGSEPDLRDSQDKSKGRKKYKAPSPPCMVQKPENWEQESLGEKDSPARKARLFKTRAETKKKSSPLNGRKYLEPNTALNKTSSKGKVYRSNENLCIEETNKTGLIPVSQLVERKKETKFIKPEMARTQSMPDFQTELREATKRMRNIKMEIKEDRKKTELAKEQKLTKEKLKTLDHNINKKDNVRQKLKQLENDDENCRINPIESLRGQPSGKESTPEPSPPRITQKEKNLPTKTFYFGMDKPVEKTFFNNAVDRFAATLAPRNLLPPNSSGSDLSSELDLEESHVSSKGIALQLRPILPKKQLEIPRFSPAAAWKLLSSVENNTPISIAPSDDGPAFIEDRIEKLSRPPPPPTIQLGPRSSHDKSGDSGISGDAGPPGFDESPEPVIINSRNIQVSQEFTASHGISWTPQQDLGDESSLEEGLNQDNPIFNSTPRFSPRSHVFSLSLPRDNHLSVFVGDKNSMQNFSGLQKIKRSVSGVLGTFGSKKDIFQVTTTQEQSDNWFFSRSAPNSLNNGFNSLELRRSQKSDDQEKNNLVPINSQSNSGRLMYLPNLDFTKNQRQSRTDVRTNFNRSKSADRLNVNPKLSLFSKSCENIATIDVKSSSEPEDLQDPPNILEKRSHHQSRKPKRFTFQSTVRQIERKRLAEKLSKEAERKEQQRLRELEAMQRVEEEFQKKRAREKATIRQQLRLFSMDEKTCSSLPLILDHKKEVPIRSEPDGAVSSSTSSPILQNEQTKQKHKIENSKQYASSSDSSDENKVKAMVTQVLSEYRQPQREYKEFRGNVRYLNEHNEAKTTVHPQVTCKMPKASNYQGSTNAGTSSNYRKDFAHGVKKSGGSSYSDDSQPNNKNHSPIISNKKHSPFTRF